MIKFPAAFAVLIAVECAGFAQNPAAGTPPVNLVANPGFESAGGEKSPVPGWGAFWSRKPGAGESRAVDSAAHDGHHALLIAATDSEGDDWAVTNETVAAVAPGDIMTLGAWSRGAQSGGDSHVSVVARDSAGKVLDWNLAPVALAGPDDAWSLHRRRFVVPAGCATVQARILGNGKASLLIDDVTLAKTGSIRDLPGDTRLPAEVRAKPTAALNVRFLTATGALAVTDRRIGRTWMERPLSPGLLVESAVSTPQGGITVGLWDVTDDLHLKATIVPAAKAAEITVVLDGDGPLPTDTGRVLYPPAWSTEKGTTLVVPLNEGILYPADDTSVRPLELRAYTGHGICMPWYGQFTGSGDADGPGVMTILGTPDDARISIDRPAVAGGQSAANLAIQPLWEGSRGRFSYARKVTFVFLPKGGYVAQAKRYREYAKASGLFKTLAQKRAENPNIDKLVGAADIWNYDLDKIAFCSEMKSLGMDRILWSGGGTPEQLAAINKLGFLTGRYDIYQDVWPPEVPNQKHDGWPEDLVWDSHGKPVAGWAARVTNKDGSVSVYPGGVICSPRGLARAKVQIPADLKTHPYGARFLDTTTASAFRECYNPDHPLTRSEDRKYKMALLEFCSKDEKLVVGSETGIDPAVPFVAYFEGMLSLAPYRLPDSGRNMLRYIKPTPEFLKYQVGPVYRVPLWELVYHDCVVADWYWGDYNNKVPEVWDRRDLFNILYGTPPMYFFDKTGWETNKDRFIASYKAVCPIVRRLGYDEMLSHRFLTPDHTLQQTKWRSGTVVTVNFAAVAQKTAEGVEVGPMGWKVTEARS